MEDRMQEGRKANAVQKSHTAVAISAAAKAGAWIRSRQGNISEIHTKETWHDLVTEVDREAEVMIRDWIAAHFPEHAFYGEETPRDAIDTAEYVWIVDPIDGTTNFVHGLSGYVVSIGLAYRGTMLIGVIYDPVQDEMYVAERGKGAYLRGKRLFVSEHSTLQHSVLACGFPVEQKYALPRALRQLHTIAPHVRNMRALGSAALHLAYIASGKLTGYWEPDLKLWDVAAGVLIVQEAGGKVTDFYGDSFRIGMTDVAATNGHIHSELLRWLERSE